MSMDRSKLARSFRELGIRVTAQRLAVAEALEASSDHPTAHVVYERVRDRFPHITLGTIYNTLAMLEEKGFVQALTFANGTRYDTNVTPHVNLVCVECGGIIDADDEDDVLARFREKICATRGFATVGQRVDFYGTCEACRSASSRPCRTPKAPRPASTGALE
ncbi:MAG: transcriptional repressor [Dehalococcoidia bacterium]|nr:transcriptional repressor [Dehalococcoidia bacterium]